jgi:hypothetical protein
MKDWYLGYRDLAPGLEIAEVLGVGICAYLGGGI